MNRLWILFSLTVSFFLILTATAFGKYLLFSHVEHNTIQIVIGWGLFFGCVGLCAALFWLPLRWEMRRLQSVAMQMTNGQLSARAPVVRKSVSEPVSTAFNQMADRLQHTIDEQEYMLQLLVHEVRTPLSRMRFALELLEAVQSMDELPPLMSSFDQNIEEMELMVQDVFEGLRAAHHGESRRVAVDLNTAVSDVVDRCGSQDVSVHWQPLDHNPTILIEPRAFRHVLRNILLNALEHSTSQVIVSVRIDTTHLFIEIHDDGPGVAFPKSVFEPFWSEHHQRTQNMGLGLTIASKICTDHGAPLAVSQSHLGGACFQSRWLLS